jgi:hypothetical protein
MRGVEESLLSRVKLAEDLNDDVALRCALGQLWECCASYSADRAKEVNATLSHLIELILPPVQKYMLLSAETSTGLYYNTEALELPAKDETRPLLCVTTDCGTKVVLKRQMNCEKPEQKERTMVELLQLAQHDVLRVRATQGEMRQIHGAIQSKLKNIIQAKAELAADVQAIDKLLFNQLYNRLTPKAAVTFVQWLEQVLISNIST